MFLRKGILKISRKITGQHPCRSVISISCFPLLCKFLQLWHGCFPVTLLHIFRTTFPRSTYGRPHWNFKFFGKSLTFFVRCIILLKILNTQHIINREEYSEPCIKVSRKELFAKWFMATVINYFRQMFYHYCLVGF